MTFEGGIGGTFSGSYLRVHTYRYQFGSPSLKAMTFEGGQENQNVDYIWKSLSSVLR